MKLSIPAGTTSKRIAIFAQDSSSTVGDGLSGLAFNTSGLKCYSWIDTDGNAAGTAQTLATATLGTWTTIGFVEKDATNMKGMYEFGVPNALIAAGVKWAILYFYGATHLAPVVVEIEVTAVSNQDAVRGGMTALPNANANAAGGLPVSAAGALDLDEMNVDIEAIQVSTAGLTFTSAGKVDANALAINGVSTGPVTTIKAVQGLATDGVVPTVTNLTNAPTAGDLTATMKVSVQTAADAAITANAVITEIEADTDTLTTGVIVTTNNDKTGYALTAAYDAAKTAAAAGAQMDMVNAPNATAIAAFVAALLTTAMTESYSALHGAPTLAQALFEILQNVGEFSITGTTITVKKRDGTTTAFTATLDDATTPTSRTRAT